MEHLFAIIMIPFTWIIELVYFVLRCRPTKKIEGQHILITGAAQGIGFEFALQLGKLGNIIHCVDRDEDLLKESMARLQEEGIQAHEYVCDLIDHLQVQKLHDDICSNGITIDYLINNAGVAFGAILPEMSLTQLRHSVTVNLIAPLWMIKLFLPRMVERNYGHVVNIASLAGYGPLKNSTDYCAAKAGCIHMMNQLRAQYGHSDVNLTVVCPFFVGTGMIRGVEDSAKPLSAAKLVSCAIKGIKENREIVIVPGIFRLVIFICNFLPMQVVDSIFVAMFKEHDSYSKNFVGQGLSEKIK